MMPQQPLNRHQPLIQPQSHRQRQQQAMQLRMEKERTQAGLLNPIGETSHYDSLTDTLTIKKSQDVEPFLNEMRREKNDNPDGFTDERTMRKIGSIPLSLAHKWLVEDGFDCLDPNNAKEVRRRLNEFTKLRAVDIVV